MQQKTNAQKIAINQNGETVSNNRNNIIVMNMEEYRKNIFDRETVKSLLKSEEDIEKGRTRKATDVINEFKEKYGF